MAFCGTVFSLSEPLGDSLSETVCSGTKFRFSDIHQAQGGPRLKNTNASGGHKSQNASFLRIICGFTEKETT